MKRQIKFITKQRVVYVVSTPVSTTYFADRWLRFYSGNVAEEMPLRNWSIEIYLIGPHGEELPATCFEKVVYTLHETFNERQVQSM